MKVLKLILGMILATIPILNVEAKYKELVLTKNNTVILDDAVTDQSVAKVIAEARALDLTTKSGEPLILFLNTPGGSIQSGIELIEALKTLNRPVHTVTLLAASMGWQIAQNLGERYIMEYGTFMSHKAAGGFQGEFGDGSSQLDSRYGFWLKRILDLDNVTVERTKGKQTLKSYRAAYENELWLGGKDAVKLGYADEVVNVRCDASLQGAKSVSFGTMFGTLVAEFSLCPLITAPVSIALNVRTNKGLMSLDEFNKKGGSFDPTCSKQELPWSLPLDKGEEVIKAFAALTVDRFLCVADDKVTMENLLKAKSEFARDAVKNNVNKINKKYF